MRPFRLKPAAMIVAVVLVAGGALGFAAQSLLAPTVSGFDPLPVTREGDRLLPGNARCSDEDVQASHDALVARFPQAQGSAKFSCSDDSSTDTPHRAVISYTQLPDGGMLERPVGNDPVHVVRRRAVFRPFKLEVPRARVDFLVEPTVDTEGREGGADSAVPTTRVEPFADLEQVERIAAKIRAASVTRAVVAPEQWLHCHVDESGVASCGTAPRPDSYLDEVRPVDTPPQGDDQLEFEVDEGSFHPYAYVLPVGRVPADAPAWSAASALPQVRDFLAAHPDATAIFYWWHQPILNLVEPAHRDDLVLVFSGDDRLERAGQLGSLLGVERVAAAGGVDGAILHIQDAAHPDP